ncbi:MAG: hypothetical protein Kow0032_28230 [Methyloligellaceae bacterium]|nr:MAG: phosphoribosyl-ATP diphosphatase [Alphaproteobacteria bacterium]
MASELETLYEQVSKVRSGAAADEKTAALFEAGREKIAKKVVEESAEVSLAYIQGNDEDLVSETADLFYNLVVLLADRGIPLSRVWEEMSMRRDALGIAGKLPKANREGSRD